MNYRSVADLNADIRGWVARLPRDFDLIVGVPRSGLLAANLLALHLNRPLADVDGFLEGRIVKGGRRGREYAPAEIRNVLVVDDSLNSGQELDAVRRRVAETAPTGNIRYAAVYIRPEMEHRVDFFCDIVDTPRVFEWNMMHHPVLLSSCLDIDGVLCIDPREEENDDGPAYERFLSSAIPLLLPTVPVGWLVTSRLEKYRAATEQWLATHGVQYRELVMMDLPDRASRLAAASHGTFKATVYRSTGADLFIESSATQAAEIASLSGKPVFCVETGQMIELPAAQETPEGPLSPDGAAPAAAGRNQTHNHDGWTAQLQAALMELLAAIPVKKIFILIDEDQLGIGPVFAGRRRVPFMEKDGQYWGAPPDDETAIREFERLRQAGADFAVCGWPAFWWLEHYVGLRDHLRSRFRCVVRTERLMIYDLRQPAETVGSETQ